MKKTLSILVLLLGFILTGCSQHTSITVDEIPADVIGSQSIAIEELPTYDETDSSVVVPEEVEHVTFNTDLEEEFETVTIELTYKFTSTNASFYVWYSGTSVGPLFPVGHTTATDADLDTWITTTMVADLTDARLLQFELLGDGTKVKSISVTPN